MGMVEGRGFQSPAPIFVAIDRVEDDVLKAEGQRRAKKYENRSDRWGQGMRGEPWIPHYEGLLAERAFAKWMNKQMGAELFKVDYEDRPRGDGGIDFRVAGLTFDVKGTGAPANVLKPMLIMRVNNGKMKSLASDIYVAVSIADKSSPALLGWIRRDDAKRFEKSPRADANHFNISVPREDLKPMCRLVKLVQAYAGGTC